jgi:glycosyltransferase involved in cell wall biosynthesis
MQPYRTYTFNSLEKPIYSVVTPIYNQENIIVKNVNSIIEKTHDLFEILLILDYCFDKTEENLLNFLDTLEKPRENLIQIRVFKNSDKPLFETKCDNIGFRASLGTYCLEIQADMEMTEQGYNLELEKPFKLFQNLLAVSGRCSHNLFDGRGYGKLGEAVEQSLETLGIQRGVFYSFETCNRGPLLLNRAKLEEMGFLNEIDFFLDNSDHDLMARAFLEKQYMCGYVPIEFKSPIADGSTRSMKYLDCPQYKINKDEKQRLSIICSGSLEKYRRIWDQNGSRDPVAFSLNL